MADCLKRAGGHDFGRHVFVDDLVYKARVCTVFQETPNEIGKQIFVRADGGVDTAVRLFRVQHQCVQGFTHAMKALEFICCGCQPHRRCDVENGSNCVRVMCRELRIYPVSHTKQLAGVADVADVSVLFGREYGESVDAFDLCAFNFGVPICAFYQTDHDFAIQLCCQCVQVVDHQRGALAVGLYDDTETIPSR